MAELKDSGARREVWRPIPGYEGLYEVSSDGRIRSLYKNTRNRDSERTLTPKTDAHDYFRVNLYKNKKSTTMLVSRIVALTFIPNPKRLPYVGHDNDNKKDNRVENLYWTDPSENFMHNGLHLEVARKRDIDKVKRALSMPVKGISKNGGTVYYPSMQAAKKDGFDSAKISMCVNGKRKSHGGYEWRLINDSRQRA